MVIALLVGSVLAAPTACVELRSTVALRTAAGAWAETTAVGEFSMGIASGLPDDHAATVWKIQRALDEGADALVHVGAAGGLPLVSRGRRPLVGRTVACPAFPPVPNRRGACTMGVCRAAGTRSDVCGIGRGPIADADAALAVVVWFAWPAIQIIGQEAPPNPIRVTLSRFEHGAAAEVSLVVEGTADVPIDGLDSRFRGRPECTIDSPAFWQELGTDLASALVQ